MTVGRYLFALVLPIAALWFGSKWQDTYGRTQHATVTLLDHTSVTGTLSRTWSGDYELQTGTGQVYRFSDFRMVAVPQQTPTKSSLWQMWRVILPFATAMFVVAVLLFPARRTIHTGATSPSFD